MSLTKADIVGRVAEGMGCVKKEAEDYVESVLAIMKETLENGETLKISGFGSFVVKQKADRRGRNPQTGETITISARRIVTFKTGQKLRSAINGEEEWSRFSLKLSQCPLTLCCPTLGRRLQLSSL